MTVFEDLGVYLASLRKQLALRPGRLYPGHGPVVEDGIAKLRDYIAHRARRDAKIMAILEERSKASK
jgi:glyoxylase-like metal-dependent hydrolase (beta-lactamase superfamily II)